MARPIGRLNTELCGRNSTLVLYVAVNGSRDVGVSPVLRSIGFAGRFQSGQAAWWSRAQASEAKPEPDSGSGTTPPIQARRPCFPFCEMTCAGTSQRWFGSCTRQLMCCTWCQDRLAQHSQWMLTQCGAGASSHARSPASLFSCGWGGRPHAAGSFPSAGSLASSVGCLCALAAGCSSSRQHEGTDRHLVPLRVTPSREEMGEGFEEDHSVFTALDEIVPRPALHGHFGDALTRWGSGAHGSRQSAGAPLLFLSFPWSLSCPSWVHLLNQLPEPKSVNQSPLLREAQLKPLSQSMRNY